MKRISIIWFALFLAISIAFATTAKAVTYTGSYDGSYAPGSTSPPVDQDTWVVLGNIAPVPNSPTVGIADFSDNSLAGGDYIGMFRNRDDIGENFLFTEDQSNDIYTITTRMKIGSNGTSSQGYGIGFGMYNESNGTSLGKMMWLNFYNGGIYDYPDNPTTGAGGITSNGVWLAGGGRCDPQESAVKITSDNYFDDQWHTFTLEKYLDGSDAKVRVLVDGSQIGDTLDYEGIADAFYDGAGVGYAGASYSTGAVEMDYFQYEITTTVEPLPILDNVVAEWTFDNATTPWADTSGNGNDLTNAGGVVRSSITSTGTGSSAYFDNSVTAKLKTTEELDLSEQQHIQLSWSQLAINDEVDIICELGANAATNPGGFYVITNEHAPGQGLVTMTNGEADNYNMAQYPHLYGEDNTTWEEMLVDISLDAVSNQFVTKVYKDGTLVGTYDYETKFGFPADGDAPEAFLNDFFNIGGRDGNDNLNFTGYIDNFTIAVEDEGVHALAGDANNDGKVDISDATILAGNWQAGVGNPDPGSITWGMGDFNGDGQIDDFDVTILAVNWQAGVTTATASVPEPGAMLLLISMFGSLLIWRRSR